MIFNELLVAVHRLLIAHELSIYVVNSTKSFVSYQVAMSLRDAMDLS